MFRRLLILLIIVSAAQSVVWNEGINGELRWGESLTLGNYSLRLSDFSSEGSAIPRILLELQEDNLTITNRVIQSGESFSLNDSIKITADLIVRDEHKDDPYARIRMQLPAVPEISILLAGDRDDYQVGDKMKLELRIENKGIVNAEDMRVALDSVPPFLNAKYYISEISAGKSWDEKKDTQGLDPIKIDLKAPYFPEPVDVKIRAHAEFKDPQGKSYESWGGATFGIFGPLQLHKMVDENQDFGEGYYVTNALYNTGNRTIDVKISDSIGSSFRSNSSLEWDLSLSPRQRETVSYRIEAENPGVGMALPSAKASYRLGNRTYIVRSESPIIDVFGPLIKVRRSINPAKIELGNVVTVSIELSNNGNKKAIASFQESLPSGADFIHGKVDDSFMLAPNEKRSLKYQLRCNKEGYIHFLPLRVNYIDVWGNKYEAIAPSLKVIVEGEKNKMTSSISIEANEKNIKEKEAEESYLVLFLITMVSILSFALSRYS